jgi:hypothetical protein
VDLAADIPASLLKILDCIALEIRAPNVFDRVAQAEPHMLGDLDALNG